MSKLAARKKGVKRTVSIGKVAPETAEQVEDLDGRIEAIQWLIPLGLQAVAEELQRAVVELAGPRYGWQGVGSAVTPLGVSARVGVPGRPETTRRCAAGAQRGQPYRGPAGCLPGTADASADGRGSAVADAEGHRPLRGSSPLQGRAEVAGADT